MSTLDPESPSLNKVVTDQMHARRSDILRQAANDLELEGVCRTLAASGTPPTWPDAVEYLRTLAPGEEGRDDSRR